MSCLHALRPVAVRTRLCRSVSTLSSNPHIYVFPDSSRQSYTYSLLPNPPSPHYIVGTSPTNPPNPSSFKENHTFTQLVQHVIKHNAVKDPAVQAQAATFASTAGSSFGSGGVLFPSNHPSQQQPKRRRKQDDGGGGASAQGGMGGAGKGGWIHVSDQRNPPDYGRIAWPEDIFGSLEVDGEGKFVGEDGNYQESGTYRVCTNEGILGLSPYLRDKLIEKLKELTQR